MDQHADMPSICSVVVSSSIFFLGAHAHKTMTGPATLTRITKVKLAHAKGTKMHNCKPTAC